MTIRDLWRRDRTNVCPHCGERIETPHAATVDYVRPGASESRLNTRLAHTWCQRARERKAGRAA